MSTGDTTKDTRAILAELEAHGSEENRAGMARFGINADRAFGVSMAIIRPMARPYRKRSDLAASLWASGKHEARILAALIEDPKAITPEQMDRWVADFDSWDLCGIRPPWKLVALRLRSETKVPEWTADEREFVRRAAFATIAGYAVHAKKAPDSEFLEFLPLIERYATDGRNFVKKAVNWALRQIGKRSPELHAPALALAQKLAKSDDKIARWIGRDAVRELTDEKQLARLGIGQP